MSKISISDLHFANDVSFVASVDVQGGDVLQAAKNRAIAAREIAGGAASKLAINSLKINPIGPIKQICPPVVAGFKPICPPKPVVICEPLPVTLGLIALPLNVM